VLLAPCNGIRFHLLSTNPISIAFGPPSPLACALPGGNQGIDQCHVRLECSYQRRARGIDKVFEALV
jgi:hypothetical protein